MFAKSISERIKTAGNRCTNATFVDMCNSAVQWSGTSKYGCTALGGGGGGRGGTTSGGQSTCSVGDVWKLPGSGLSSGFSSESSGVPPLPIATPLELDLTTTPPSVSLVSRDACRFNYTKESREVKRLTALSQLSAHCKNVSGVDEDMWKALINANITEPANWVRSDKEDTQEFKKACTFCFCDNLKVAQPLLWAESWDFSGYRARVRTDAEDAPCTSQATQTFQFQALQVVSALLVLVFNSMMKTSTQLLAKFERHATLTLQESSIALAVFLSQFVNTGLVALFVYGNLGQSAENAFQGFVFGGPYNDFSVDWYRVVGAQLSFTVATNVVMPAVPVVTGALMSCIQPCMPLPLMQADLDKAMVGPDFFLSTRYGMLMNSIMVCLLFSAGIPLLYFVAGLVCFATYAVDKIMLLRIARQPPQFDQSLTKQFLRVIPVGILLHSLWGVWMFSSAGMWPRPPVFGLDKQFAKLENEMWPCLLQNSSAACAAKGAVCVWDQSQCSINTNSEEVVGYRAFNVFPRLFNGVTIIYSLIALVYSEYIYVYTYIHIYICVCVYVCTHTYMCIDRSFFLRMVLSVIPVCVCLCVCVCVCVCGVGSTVAHGPIRDTSYRPIPRRIRKSSQKNCQAGSCRTPCVHSPQQSRACCGRRRRG